MSLVAGKEQRERLAVEGEGVSLSLQLLSGKRKRFIIVVP